MATDFHVTEQTGSSVKKQIDSNSSMYLSFHVNIYIFSPLGWCEGERLRDGERGWFLAECAEPITCLATIERNVQRMDRLQGLETNV